MNCPNCGNTMPDGSAFCTNCGTPLSDSVAPVTPAPVAPASPYEPVQPTVQPEAVAGQPGVATPPEAVPYAAQPAGQPMYQQPTATQKVYAQTTGNTRALAMGVYWGLLPLIFAIVAGDKDTDPFLKHHLNQALVILIGSIICSFLTVIIIGFIGLIFLFVMGIMGTIQAYHSEMTELPLIGKMKLIK